MARPKRSTVKQVNYNEIEEDEELAQGSDKEDSVVVDGAGKKRLLQDSVVRPAKRQAHVAGSSLSPSSRLAPELLTRILTHLSHSKADKPALAAACLVSRSFYALARPLLYRTLFFNVAGNNEGEWWILEPASAKLSNQLKQRPELASLVQVVNFAETEPDFHYGPLAEDEAREPWCRYMGFTESASEIFGDIDVEDQFWERVMKRATGDRFKPVTDVLDALKQVQRLNVNLDSGTNGEPDLQRVWEAAAKMPHLEHLQFPAWNEEYDHSPLNLNLDTLPELRSLALVGYLGDLNAEGGEFAEERDALKRRCEARGVAFRLVDVEMYQASSSL